jgi:hypothetical protein
VPYQSTIEVKALQARTLIIGLAMVGTATASFSGTIAAHAASSTAVIGEVDLKMVEPSTVTLTGSFKLEILAGPGSSNVASFDLYRVSGMFGNQLLGHFTGTSHVDTVVRSYDIGQYEMVPYDSAHHVGTGVFSASFVPFAFDYTNFAVTVGMGTDVPNSKDYFGSMEETATLGAVALIDDDGAYNDAIVVGTGPQGGIATVTDSVSGGPAVTVGTIDFYSKKAGYNKVLFKFGTHAYQSNLFSLTVTGAGPKGGFDMYLDSLVEIYPS